MPGLKVNTSLYCEYQSYDINSECSTRNIRTSSTLEKFFSWNSPIRRLISLSSVRVLATAVFNTSQCLLSLQQCRKKALWYSQYISRAGLFGKFITGSKSQRQYIMRLRLNTRKPLRGVYHLVQDWLWMFKNVNTAVFIRDRLILLYCRQWWYTSRF